MKSEVDSVKYQVAIRGMWFDFRTLNPEYLRSLLLQEPDLSCKHLKEILLHILSMYRFFLEIGAIHSFFLFMILLYGRDKRMMVKITIFQLGVLLIIIGLDFNGFLVDHRHFLNIQLIALLISTLFFCKSGVAKSGPIFLKRAGIAIVVLVLTSIPLSISYIKQMNNDMIRDVACRESAMESLEGAYDHQTFILTLGSWFLTNHNFSIFTKTYKKNRYLLYDVFTYSIIPSYQRYQTRLCDCDAADPTQFFHWIADQHMRYVADPERFDLTKKYMHLVHHFDMDFVTDSGFVKEPCLADHQNQSSYMDIRVIKISKSDIIK
jgi:hypothetical protein